MKWCASYVLTFLFLFIGSFVPSYTLAGYYYVTKNITWTVVEGRVRDDLVTNWIAKAYYNDSYNKTGWDILEVKTNFNATDSEQMFGAGFLEGYLTYDRIYYYWHNACKHKCDTTSNTCDRVKRFINENTKNMRLKTEENLSDPYWYQVYLFYKQVEGIHKGYQEAPKDNIFKNLTLEDVIWINFLLEIDSDLIPAFSEESEKQFIKGLTHCSALIKLLPGYKDVLFGHNMWGFYNSMHRILKRYSFSIHVSNNSNELIPGMISTFSSYAGTVTSADDFYLISSGLFAMETTNDVIDERIYSNIKASQVSESIRSMVANRLATDGQSWYSYFKKHNNGAYNNQWMILNLNKFRPGFQPKEGFLWVIEQMPGLIEGADQTDMILKSNYWASYNEPFYPTIYNYSGTETLMNSFGLPNSHEFSARAMIFKREHNSVQDVESMYHLLRFNHYKDDPYSVCKSCINEHNPSLSIASRYDLIPENETGGNFHRTAALFGAIDAKVSSYTMFSKGEIYAVSGPTNENVPPFKWEPHHYDYHLGQPSDWEFPPILTKWPLENPVGS